MILCQLRWHLWTNTGKHTRTIPARTARPPTVFASSCCGFAQTCSRRRRAMRHWWSAILFCRIWNSAVSYNSSGPYCFRKCLAWDWSRQALAKSICNRWFWCQCAASIQAQWSMRYSTKSDQTLVGIGYYSLHHPNHRLPPHLLVSLTWRLSQPLFSFWVAQALWFPSHRLLVLNS